jgi:predicted RNA-binding protein YlxR (DUF448 family)
MSKKAQQRPRKHIPMRTCVVCRQQFSKRDITRIVRTADEGVVVDSTGKLNGRGAYLCSKPSCWDKAVAGKILDQALKTMLTEQEKVAIGKQRPAEVVPQ